jgi:hypothetical protein
MKAYLVGDEKSFKNMTTECQKVSVATATIIARNESQKNSKIF